MVEGENTTTQTIRNLSAEMNGYDPTAHDDGCVPESPYVVGGFDLLA